jgi:RNA 2',3'-cyclic 3'-phosphodiesterase
MAIPCDVGLLDSNMRAFIAIKLPEDVLSELPRVQDRLRQSGVEASWVRPGGIHLTLKFLGEVDESQQGEIFDAIRKAAAGISRFRIAVAGAGAFPNSRNARVIWLGITGDLAPLATLHAAIEEVMAGLGFKREDRKFTPHLTLARIRQGRPQSKLQTALEEIRDTGLPAFEVAGVSFMKSDLLPSGAVYTELGRAELES